MSSKLTSLFMNFVDSSPNIAFEHGFRQAFKLINESIDKEIIKIEEYPWMGERIHSLKLYKKKVNEVLKDMEQEYE